MEYTELLLRCDSILAMFSNKTSVFKNDIYPKHNSNDNTEWVNTNLAITKLEEDGHIISLGNAYYKLGGNATFFISEGGYENWVKKYNEKEAKKTDLERLNEETNRNTIDTGKSVQKLNSLLIPATKLQIFIACLTMGIAILAAWISWLNYEETKTNDDLIQRLNSTEKLVKEIQLKVQQKQQLEVKPVVHPITPKLK